MDPRELLEQAFLSHGITDLARLDSHVRGCDLTSPVTQEELAPGATFDSWVRNGGAPGKFGAPLGEDPRRLGIKIDRRHRQVYRVRVPLQVIRCTAATFLDESVDDVGGEGGAIQYLLPPGWENSVERIA